MKQVKLLLENVKFEHSIFAVPFAYLGMILGLQGLPTWHQFIWITVAMLGARTLAMSLNRLIDREIDRQNPRTANRPIPSGRLSTRAVALASLLSGVVFVFATMQLSELAVKLLPLAILLLVGYHYTKRFTWMSHGVLGLADGAAPIGGWVAVTNSLDLPAVVLGLGVALWVGGFDLVYSCQDVEFDRTHGLHSVPVRFGVPAALWSSRIAHVGTVVCLAAVGLLMGLGSLYWVGWLLAGGLLVYEHSIVTPTDLSRLSMAFFNMNGYIAVAVFSFTFAAVMLR